MAPPLTLDQLLASFPDNTTGQIGPDNFRDFVESVELKYDNWTVVKPAQPNGNKFPDPVGGEIILPENTAWLINGAVTVADTIIPADNVLIQSTTGSFSGDALLLDVNSGAIPLFKNNVNDVSFSIIGLRLSTNAIAGGAGRLFECATTFACTVTSCAFIDSNLGSWSQANLLIFRDIQSALILGTLSFTGACGRMNFIGNSTFGSPAGIAADLFDFTGATIQELAIQRNNAAIDGIFSMYVFNNDDNADIANVTGNTVIETSTGFFVKGVNATTGIKFTFAGNTGIQDSMPGGGIIIAGNAAVTINPGADVWTPILGNGTDVLTGTSQRFIRSGSLALQYVGISPISLTMPLAVTLRRSVGGGDVTYSISIFINGVIVDESGVEVSQSTETDGTTNQAVPVSIPLNLVNGDIITPVIRGDAHPEDSVVENIQMIT